MNLIKYISSYTSFKQFHVNCVYAKVILLNVERSFTLKI
jgi:hypothetical protein